MTDPGNESQASSRRPSSHVVRASRNAYVVKPSPFRRGAQVLVVLVAVAALATTAVVIHGSRTSSSSDAGPAVASGIDASTSAGTARRSMLYIGDSYTAGPTGQPEFGYACLTASAFGSNCNLGAVAGTGYINGGPDHRLPGLAGASDTLSTSLQERLPELREKFSADVVVLDAGRNDLPYGAEGLTRALLYTVSLAQQTWRGAQIVVIAPWFIFRPRITVPTGSGTVTPIGDFISTRMRRSSQFDDVIFVDPGRLGWFARQNTRALTDQDGLHLTVQGNQRTALLLARALSAATDRRTQ